MKRYIKRTVAIVLLVVLSFSILSLIQTPYGHVVNIIQGFYREEKNSIDVVFVGASEVSAGYSAPYAYSLYGYTSYPYAIDGTEIKDIKHYLVEINDNQNPKLIAIDISCATSYSHKNSGNEPSRVLVDNIPISKHKLELLGMYHDVDERVNSLFPFMTHHGFLPDFEYLKFFFRKENLLKGTYARSSSIQEAGQILELDSKKRSLPDEYEEEVIDLLEFCKENNLNVLFMRFPNRVNDEAFLKRYQEGNYILDLIESKGFPVLDCMTPSFLDQLDYQKDFYTNDHMSICGQKKLTVFLGDTLYSKWHIRKSELSAKNKELWKNSADCVLLFYEYVQSIESTRKREEPIYIYETSDLIKKLNEMKN